MVNAVAVFFDVDGTMFRWQTMHVFIEEMVNHGVFPNVVKSMCKKQF